jgi:uncharacterized damage-inducible protein DinB
MLKEAFINEIKHEGANTRKMLERVPFENPGWQPHEKSRNMEALARHVANIYNWIPYIVNHDEIDFAKGAIPPLPDIKSSQELVSFYDKSLISVLDSVQNTNDEDLMKPFVMRRGDQIFSTMPRAVTIRNMALNHLVHHRGQLGVYLRLNDVPVPGMYGPSADE